MLVEQQDDKFKTENMPTSNIVYFQTLLLSTWTVDLGSDQNVGERIDYN